jgi:hypothetical protein
MKSCIFELHFRTLCSFFISTWFHKGGLPRTPLRQPDFATETRHCTPKIAQLTLFSPDLFESFSCWLRFSCSNGNAVSAYSRWICIESFATLQRVRSRKRRSDCPIHSLLYWIQYLANRWWQILCWIEIRNLHSAFVLLWVGFLFFFLCYSSRQSTRARWSRVCFF